MTENNKTTKDHVSSIRFIASAGTGKTHRVTGLYTALILGHPYPEEPLGPIAAGGVFDGSDRVPCEEILMLTFARNAASEMRTRITTEIEKQLEADPDRADFYWQLLRRISGAVISTIHAFGQRLIAQNALSLGIAPSFRVLEEDEAESLRKETMAAELRRSLSESSPEEREAMESLCLGRRPGDLVTAAGAFIHQCDSLGVDISVLAPEELLPVPAVPAYGDLLTLEGYFDESCADKKPYKPALAFIAELRDELSSLDRGSAGRAVSASASRLLDLTKGGWGKEGMKEVKDIIKSRLEVLKSYPDQVRARELLFHFLGYVSRCKRVYEEAKKEQGVLDFTDLLLKSRDLVRQTPTILPDFSVIIVDEAQDNSRAQNELIETIRAATGASLVLCGDIKQTIHTWRGADPDGMAELSQRLKLAPVPLRVSYRSQKSILDWVNDLFRAVVFDPQSYDEDAHLLPCDRAPADSGPAVELILPEWESSFDQVTVPKSTPEEKAMVELTDRDLKTIVESGKKVGGIPADRWSEWSAVSDERLSREARVVALRISLLCRPDSESGFRPRFLFDSDKWWDNDRVHYRHRDITILLRATGRQELYEAALRERGIPYTTGGKGRGFYFRQEVRDISNLLNMLAFPRDDLALLAVARSPFFSLSDEAIGILLTGKNGVPRGYRIRRALYSGAPRQRGYEESLHRAGLAEEIEVYRRAVRILNLLRRLAGRLNGVDLIRRAIDLTGYDAILAGSFNGLQKLANLRALLANLQDRERREHLDLAGLARLLVDEIKDETKDPDAAVLDPSNDAVTISTVHAAKGLSSPVVFIPDLRRPPRPGGDWIRIRRSGGGEHIVTGKTRVIGDEGEQLDLGSAGLEEAREAVRAEEDEESRRLFYVAATRARDLVVLSGENAGRKGAWREWINKYLLLTGKPPELVRIVPYRELLKASSSADRAGKRIVLPSAGQLSAVPARAETVSLPETYRLAATVLSGVPERRPGESDDESRKARRDYARTGLVNLPPAYFMSKGSPDSTGGEGEDQVMKGGDDPENAFSRQVSAGLFGHSVLENLDYQKPLAPQIENAVSSYGGDESAISSLRRQLGAGASAVAGMLAGVRPEEIIRELPFAARFTHGGATVIVDGAIDLLYLKDGAWHIVDYKFSGRPRSDLKKKYDLQLGIYRDAVSGAIPGQVERLPFFQEGAAPAVFTITILGIGVDGTIRNVTLSNEEVGDVPARVIAAARLIRSECTPHGPHSAE